MLADAFVRGLDQHRSTNFVLDVPFDKREAGTDNNALSVIKIDNEKNKKKNPARRFVVNPDGTISTAASPHLVLGLREGTVLLHPALDEAVTVAPVVVQAVAVATVPSGLPVVPSTMAYME